MTSIRRQWHETTTLGEAVNRFLWAFSAGFIVGIVVTIVVHP